MWGLTPVRLSILAGVVLAAFVAGGIATWWGLAAPRILAANERGQAALNNLRADYSTKLAAGERAARNALEAEVTKAEEADRAYQAELERIRAEAAARPPRIVRVWVPCAAPNPGPTPGDDPAGGPGVAAGAPADGPGMGPDGPGGYRTLDVSGIDAITDRGKAVSAQLRALQERCDASH
jgi:hypothetical protein